MWPDNPCLHHGLIPWYQHPNGQKAGDERPLSVVLKLIYPLRIDCGCPLFFAFLYAVALGYSRRAGFRYRSSCRWFWRACSSLPCWLFARETKWQKASPQWLRLFYLLFSPFALVLAVLRLLPRGDQSEAGRRIRHSIHSALFVCASEKACCIMGT